jgi:hypothetical protein
VGDEAGDKYEIKGSVADDGVGDLKAAALGVGDPELDHGGGFVVRRPQPGSGPASAAAKLAKRSMYAGSCSRKSR